MRARLVLAGLRALIVVLDVLAAIGPVLFFVALFWLLSVFGLWDPPWDPRSWEGLP